MTQQLKASRLKIAIAGLGVVGGGVYKILTKNIALLNKRAKSDLELVAVSSRTVKDFVNQSQIKFYNNTLDLADDKDIDIIVELIGGSEGTAYELAKKALKNKKHFVTANKALIAVHGLELAKLAEENNVALCFEAAVAGSIPILKSLKEGLIANNIDQIYGILNGTCNYILTKMQTNGLNFAEVLKEAQQLGYAEADPTFDIEAIDSAHKLAILAAIAKNCRIDFNALYIEGITKITIDDIKFAEELGYKIKLLGIFKDLNNGFIEQNVYPALIKYSEKIAVVDDSYNAVLTHGDNCDWNLQIGRGAGALPTASAVVADILDIAGGNYGLPFGCKVSDLIKVKTSEISQRTGGYYLRFKADKQFAKESNFITEVFGNSEIIEQSIIKEADDNNLIYALKTKDLIEKEFNSYLEKLEKINQINDIHRIRIEKTGL